MTHQNQPPLLPPHLKVAVNKEETEGEDEPLTAIRKMNTIEEDPQETINPMTMGGKPDKGTDKPSENSRSKIDAITVTMTQTIVASTTAVPQIKDLDETKLQPIWEDLHKVYQKSLLIKFRDINKFHIWISEPQWTIAEESTAISFDTKEPSAFKIVLRSRMPFHGPMPNSLMNRKFLSACGFTSPPEQVTIIPLFDEKYIIGFLFTVSNSSANSAEALKVAEDCGSKVSYIITDIIHRAA